MTAIWRTFYRGVLGGTTAIALSTAAAQRPLPTAKIRVAVMDLSGALLKMQTTTAPTPQAPAAAAPGQQTTTTVALPPPAEFARGLTEMLTSTLVKSSRVIVLDRAAMPHLDAEQALTTAGRTTKESGAQQGALLGAQALITGDITGFTFNRSNIGAALHNLIKGVNANTVMVSAEVTIDLRLVDATTGEVIASSKGTGKAAQVGVAADLTRGDQSFGSDAQITTPLGQASRGAIEKATASLLNAMPKIRWSARVVDVRDGIVYVNATSADGMRPGLELDVFEMQPPLIDPATGQSLGAPERIVGRVVMENVFEKFSTARAVSGGAIARGNVLRLRSNP
jgi:curli biogenesis system outer membrane secretion channel CsgG